MGSVIILLLNSLDLMYSIRNTICQHSLYGRQLFPIDSVHLSTEKRSAHFVLVVYVAIELDAGSPKMYSTVEKSHRCDL